MAQSKARSRLASFGNGLLAAAVLATDLPIMDRMTTIEYEIDRLQKEYAELNAKLDSTHSRKTPYQK